MSSILEEIDKLVIHDDIDFEITKYVDDFMNHDESEQKDTLHNIIKHTLEYRDKIKELNLELYNEQQKYNTIYNTNVILVNQLKCSERANNTLSKHNDFIIQEKNKKMNFMKKLMKYSFIVGTATFAGFYYISRKS